MSAKCVLLWEEWNKSLGRGRRWSLLNAPVWISPAQQKLHSGTSAVGAPRCGNWGSCSRRLPVSAGSGAQLPCGYRRGDCARLTGDEAGLAVLTQHAPGSAARLGGWSNPNKTRAWVWLPIALPDADRIRNGKCQKVEIRGNGPLVVCFFLRGGKGEQPVW